MTLRFSSSEKNLTLQLSARTFLVGALRHSIAGSGSLVGTNLIVLTGWIAAIFTIAIWLVRKRPFWKMQQGPNY